mmetsp:Transcript_38465/g.88791  ORF Transcript_38465/g.88791 Transcript_38465/m.88791 type:complete len:86 (+) Transcript_38465:854-1111(+)
MYISGECTIGRSTPEVSGFCSSIFSFAVVFCQSSAAHKKAVNAIRGKVKPNAFARLCSLMVLHLVDCVYRCDDALRDWGWLEPTA